MNVTYQIKPKTFLFPMMYHVGTCALIKVRYNDGTWEIMEEWCKMSKWGKIDIILHLLKGIFKSTIIILLLT